MLSKISNTSSRARTTYSIIRKLYDEANGIYNQTRGQEGAHQGGLNETHDDLETFAGYTKVRMGSKVKEFKQRDQGHSFGTSSTSPQHEGQHEGDPAVRSSGPPEINFSSSPHEELSTTLGGGDHFVAYSHYDTGPKPEADVVLEGKQGYLQVPMYPYLSYEDLGAGHRPHSQTELHDALQPVEWEGQSPHRIIPTAQVPAGRSGLDTQWFMFMHEQGHLLMDSYGNLHTHMPRQSL